MPTQLFRYTNVRFNSQDSTISLDVAVMLRRPVPVSEVVLVSRSTGAGLECTGTARLGMRATNPDSVLADGSAVWRVRTPRVPVVSNEALPKRTLIFKVNPSCPLVLPDGMEIRGLGFSLKLHARPAVVPAIRDHRH